jgi:hypothetical protein
LDLRFAWRVLDDREVVPFTDLVLDAIEASAAPSLVAREGGAVVLERIARGAGATRWFALRNPDQIPTLAQRLSPGSLVSFYFDGRLAGCTYDREVARAVLAIAEHDGDAVIGRLRVGEIDLEVEFVAGPSELAAYESGLAPGAEVIFGRFPAPDNDGERAVTITIPDRDGVGRGHPH